MKANVLIREAISLPVEERVYLVDCLLQTLNTPDPTHTAAWGTVARCRLDAIRSNKVAPIPGAEVFARIQQRYNK